jgi:hypothetical protein
MVGNYVEKKMMLDEKKGKITKRERKRKEKKRIENKSVFKILC